LTEAIENAATRGTVRVNVQALAPAGQFEFENYSAFEQDTWRATPKLTLTYGLRYDINLPPSSSDALPFTINGLDNPLTATLAPQGTKAFEATYNNLRAAFWGGIYARP
jgi:outer membrane receptor protein involved in Fe transport